MSMLVLMIGLTHTGGYNPTDNSVAERRIGMLNQSVRTILLCATGGFKYYDQLWGRALVHSSGVIDWTHFSDMISPLSVFAGRHVEPLTGDTLLVLTVCTEFLERRGRSLSLPLEPVCG